MKNYDKAAAIADKLRNISRLTVTVTAEDVMSKVKSPQELDFYYRKLILEG